jgi:hypothetical protein
MRVTVGSTQFEYNSFSLKITQVVNDFSGNDTYDVFARGTDSGNDYLDTDLILRDLNLRTFSSDAPSTALVLSDCEQHFALFFPVSNSANDSLVASIDNSSVNAVPVPAGLVLGLIRLPMVAWLRRRVS